MANELSKKELIARGILSQNPIFKLALSMCPAVGMSTTVKTGLMLGVAVFFVQVFSSLTISLIKNYIHPRIRIPTYTLVIATWVTVIDLVLAAYFPAAYAEMGIFIKLIVAFAIITMRLEMFACKESVSDSVVDGAGMGLGFLIGMVCLGFVRELIGNGTVFGYEIFDFKPFMFFILPCAGFFVVGLMMAFFNWIETRYRERMARKS